MTVINGPTLTPAQLLATRPEIVLPAPAVIEIEDID